MGKPLASETRYILAPGETWKIPENAVASGAHHWIFARGRGVILAGPSDHPMNPIQTVGAGATSLVSENLCIQSLGSFSQTRFVGSIFFSAFFSVAVLVASWLLLL